MGKIWDQFKRDMGDQVRGSIKYGPSTSYRHNKAAMDAARAEREEREARYADRFGAGEAYGDRNWSEPLHATTQDGRPVTVSFGRGPRTGETLICDGHVSAQQFYERGKDGLKGHDHYLVDGRPAADRARYSD